MLIVPWQTKSVVSLPLEDKNVVNGVLTWCISIYHVIGLKQTRSIKNVTLRRQKKSWASQSTGKSSIAMKANCYKTGDKEDLASFYF